ncbi:cytochrome C [Sulfurimonas sediminis]|uniref:Cytochrome C n=1 Tax=Sulfurimonas sediminis TaxID=2590020 RepID=A0A7M1B480_9BACT|nr:cytochrome C [Sulfurimonas sediminis]QOP44531.1 cytochrome C [Sulfurimonas sediminis]
MKKVLKSIILLSAAVFIQNGLYADQFTQKDLDFGSAEYKSVVKEGRKVFTDTKLGTNTVTCNECHPNATNTHPETYPKFQKQLGKVATMGEMINWCIANPLEGKKMALDNPKMTALIAYITHERKGVKLAPGKH